MSGAFTDEQMERHARHILLPEIGGRGVRRLLGANVLVIGAGGVGSPALLYLAAAGVGRVAVIDSDSVELSNLHRQVIHATPDVGRSKVDSAAETLRALNHEVEMLPHCVRLTADNALDLIRGHDAVIDGSDNFSTRYLVNDACHFTGTPLFTGATLRFEGQVSVFRMQGDGPCLRCLFPEPPPHDLTPGCQEAGVLGPLVGVIGSLVATEVIKHLAGVGESLEGTLLTFDALGKGFRQVTVRRNPTCRLCGENPSITRVVTPGESGAEQPA